MALRSMSIGLSCAMLSACVTTDAPNSITPQDGFFAALTARCGQAYAGALISTDTADADMSGRAMVMELRSCSAQEIRIPFHVQRADGSWDRSRTWVINRTVSGLRLKHDHRHEDGSADAVTMYGGDTIDMGSAAFQNFPVDADSIALFQREGLERSVTNIWSVAISASDAPDAHFTYALTRSAPHVRSFRVRFDLTRPVTAPPPPWGAMP